MVDQLKFHAWLDGELDERDAEVVAAEVERDPELQRKAEEHRALSARLKAAFDPIAHAPVPERLTAAVGGAEIIDFAASIRQRKASWFTLPQLMAMAASLVVGIITGTLIAGNSAQPISTREGQLIATASLAKALDRQLASAGEQEGVRIGLTFRDRSGAFCRSFTRDLAAGLACRDDGRWAIRGLFASPPGQQPEYRMAAGEDPQLLALLDRTMTGEPLDAAQEQAARTGGWR